MPDVKRTILLVPAAGSGEGMGHLLRCLSLADRLGGTASIWTARMDQPARDFLAQKLRGMPSRTRPGVLHRMQGSERWDLILLDARRTSRDEIELLMRHGLVVCLDEGGDGASCASFLVDAIPGIPGSRPANLASPAFLSLPPRSRRTVRLPPRRVLVSFGGEDRRHLSERLLKACLEKGVFEPGQLTVAEGPLFGRRTWPEGVVVIRAHEGLQDLLRDFDLLISHFGITALESLAAGVPVILLNPTRYHARLGEAAGFASIGTRAPNLRALRRLLADPVRLAAHVRAFHGMVKDRRSLGLAELLQTISVQGSSSCPLCGRVGNPVIGRFPDRTYRRCRSCGIVSLESFSGEKKRYDAGYFSSEYRKQYGRTYLEDFESIKSASRARIERIRTILGTGPDGMVIDVGCAYGPFLDALKEAGLRGYGVDVAADAVSYVRKTLGIPALHARFETVKRSALPRRISAVTMWYVIEHFTQIDEAIRKAAGLLQQGGVLAFSTPNGRGISALRSLVSFLRASPGDHFTILSPRGLGRILSRYGLELRAVRVTGHHPERFPGLLGRAAVRSAWVSSALNAVSRLLGLGDTFEAYAVREES
jgi:2-polyprenyl-3-methyl-5-hydroxy-6-metoxy-1,4-benzoquinol methylase